MKETSDNAAMPCSDRGSIYRSRGHRLEEKLSQIGHLYVYQLLVEWILTILSLSLSLSLSLFHTHTHTHSIYTHYTGMPTVLISTAVSLLILKITYHIYNLKLYIQNDTSFES